MARTLYLGNDLDLTLPSITVARSGAAVTTATVTWTLLGPTGSTLGTGSLTYNPTSTQYEGVIESSVFASQAVNSVLTLRITAVDGNRDANWTDDRCVVKRRPFEV